MEEENRWERVEEDSPLRCQAVIATKGQCLNKRCDDSEFCPAHGGNRGGRLAKLKRSRMYKIERYQQKIDAMADHEGAKSLSDELAIMRMMLETRLQQCHSDLDLMLHSQSISTMVGNIEKLVTSSTRLEERLGNMLDTNQALQWMAEICEIIGTYVQDEAVLDSVAADIMDSFQRIQGRKEKCTSSSGSDNS